jgi:hypothetical protein
MEKRKKKGKGKAKDHSSNMDGVQDGPKQNSNGDFITGYMTNEIFLEWLQRFQLSIVSENPKRKILLLMDNAGCHTKAIKGNAHLFENIQVVFLPPNSTSVTQPLDAGIMAVFKMRYRQIIGDKTILLRVRNDLDKSGSRRRAKNPWNIKVSNLEAWNSIVRAWGYVKPESIRNCFRHVPILCDRQKELLSEYNGATETEAIDPCVHEAVVSRRDIDDMIEKQDEGSNVEDSLDIPCEHETAVSPRDPIENQDEESNIENQDEESNIENQDEESNIEGSLEIPFQYVHPVLTPRPTDPAAIPREKRSVWTYNELARSQLYNNARMPMVRQANEVLETAYHLRVRAAKVFGIPAEQIDGPQYSLRRIPQLDDQRANISDIERDRATTLAGILDGSPFLCELVKEHTTDGTFMSYFKAEPAGTVILGHEWLASDSDTSDDDYSASSDDSTSVDGVDGTVEDDLEPEEEPSDPHDVSMEDVSDMHNILMHAAQIIPKEYSDLKERLETVADASLGLDFFDADEKYVSQFEEEERKKKDLHQQRLIHDAEIKSKYPQVKFPVMVLGTAECSEESIEMET